MPTYKDKNGSWYCKFYYREWNGKLVQKKKSGFKFQRDAKQFEQEFLRQYSGTCDMSFKSMTELYLNDCKVKLKPTTIPVKESVLKRRIIPILGNMPVNQITPNIIRQFYNSLVDDTADYSNEYMKKVAGQVSCVLQFAVKYYGLSANPCKSVELPNKSKLKSINFWTLEEYKKFIKAVKTANRPELYIAYETLFWTGMRSGELLALQIGNIDFNSKIITINKNFAKIHGEEYILTPKSKKSRRNVEFPSFLADELQEYIHRLYKPESYNRLIICSRSMLQQKIKVFADIAGVKHIRVHDLRHSHASLLIEMGCQPLMVADRLGHESIKTTLETYSHLYPNKQSEICKRLQSFCTD